MPSELSIAVCQNYARRQFLARSVNYATGLFLLPLALPIERLFGQTFKLQQAKDACSVQNKIIKIIAEQLQIDEKKIALTSNFTEDLGADSLDVVELVMQVEEAFNIRITDTHANRLRTVGSTVAYVSAHLSKAQLASFCSREQAKNREHDGEAIQLPGRTGCETERRAKRKARLSGSTKLRVLVLSRVRKVTTFSSLTWLYCPKTARPYAMVKPFVSVS